MSTHTTIDHIRGNTGVNKELGSCTAELPGLHAGRELRCQPGILPGSQIHLLNRTEGFAQSWA